MLFRTECHDNVCAKGFLWKARLSKFLLLLLILQCYVYQLYASTALVLKQTGFSPELYKPSNIGLPPVSVNFFF